MTGQEQNLPPLNPGNGLPKTNRQTSESKVEIETPRRKLDWGTIALGAACFLGLLLAAWRPW
jgi:hypothetical protein